MLIREDEALSFFRVRFVFDGRVRDVAFPLLHTCYAQDTVAKYKCVATSSAPTVGCMHGTRSSIGEGGSLEKRQTATRAAPETQQRKRAEPSFLWNVAPFCSYTSCALWERDKLMETASVPHVWGSQFYLSTVDLKAPPTVRQTWIVCISCSAHICKIALKSYQ